MFAADKTANLIVRLQYNVIRAGLRRINLAYSRISLADVASRLGAPLPSAVPPHVSGARAWTAVPHDPFPNAPACMSVSLSWQNAGTCMGCITSGTNPQRRHACCVPLRMPRCAPVDSVSKHGCASGCLARPSPHSPGHPANAIQSLTGSVHNPFETPVFSSPTPFPAPSDNAYRLFIPRPGLASVEDTECIVAKAIRDGGIDAALDHAAGCMLSKDTPDVYATAEPAAAFHARVAFCLDIHNEARPARRSTALPDHTGPTTVSTWQLMS